MNILKYIIFIIATLLLGNSCSRIATSYFIRDLDWRKSEYRVKRTAAAELKLSDSTILIADIYHPKGIDTAPTILVRVPLDDNGKSRFRSKVFGQMWASRGYNVVIQGVRGRFGSGGVHIPFKTEREDGIATLEWINKQSWHNGKIGMWGGSYFGYTQWVLYDQKSLGLDAMLVHISSSSNYDMFYPSGAFSLETALYWSVRSRTTQDAPFKYEELKPAYETLNLFEIDNAAVSDIPFYNDWVAHNTTDSFWNRIDGKDRINELQMPVLLMAGWFDPYLQSMVNDWNGLKQNPNEEVRNGSVLVIGPWGHANTITMPDGYVDKPYRVSSVEYSIDWFDRHVMRRRTEPHPPVKLFVMGINQWRYENEFPLARTEYRKFFLNERVANDNDKKGTLDTAAGENVARVYIYDPANPVPSIGGSVLGERSGTMVQNPIQNRKDVLLFSTPVLQEDMEITGQIELVLYVKTDALNTDFTAKLTDVYPDGNAWNISEGIVRQDYLPRSISRLSIRLNPTSNVFKKGHLLRLEVSSSNYPRYSRNFNSGNNISPEGMVKAVQTVLCGKDFPSHLILPVIPIKK